MIRPRTRDVIVLLITLACGYVLLEAVSYVRMQRGSGRGHRIVTERNEAVALPPRSSGNRPTVLFVGNSLLREAVDMDELRKTAGDMYDVHRLVVESTGYSDWSLAIPALLERGARPAYLVLVLSPLQMESNAPVSMETVHYLLNPQDVRVLAQRDGGGPSTYAGRFLEYVSPYWGTRNSAQAAFKSLIPGYRSTIYALANEPVAPQMFDAQRMKTLASACQKYGVQLIYLAPPANDPNGNRDASSIEAAARQLNVPYLRPVPDDAIPADEYTDSIHLNEKGRQRFEAIFFPALTGTLDQLERANK